MMASSAYEGTSFGSSIACLPVLEALQMLSRSPSAVVYPVSDDGYARSILGS